MSEDIRKMIDKVKNFKQFVNEQTQTNDIKELNVGDVVILTYSTPPKYRDMYSSSIINNYAVITHIPENATFLYGRFVVGHSPTKIKPESINWEYTNRISEVDKEKYREEMKHWNFLKEGEDF